jgi:hypothetical protein
MPSDILEVMIQSIKPIAEYTASRN